MEQTAQESFQLALAHLERVQDSWDDPTDWANLSSYGLYCLEACIVAAALHSQHQRPRTHYDKVGLADLLTEEQDLPDIGSLLVDLNEMRKHEAYGDVYPPEGLDPGETAKTIGEYVDSVGTLLEQ